jgi:hypothetical protein
MPRKKKEEAGAEDLVDRSAELVKTSLALTRDVWERAKIRALREGITLAKIVENSLQRYLDEIEKEKK